MTDDPEELYNAEVVPPKRENPFRDTPEQHNPYTSPTTYQQPQSNLGDDVGMRMLLPVGRSLWAVASGYLALFIPVMCITAQFALFTGIMAVREIKRNPKLHGLGRAWFGIIAGTLGIFGLIFFIIAIVMEGMR
jgi:hypothetical protein